MKELRLRTMELMNFKGIRNLTIDANGFGLSVYGDNGTGKTTIADAFSWLLFGKDSAGRSDFEVKTLLPNGNPVHFLDHSVTATLDINGEEVTLQRVYREKWVKQRGSVDKEFQGHETEYFIDGIPKSKGEYTTYIKSIADEELFRLLTNPMYFNNNIDKKKRREMLFGIFGEITNEDVIVENFALLGDLRALVGKYTIEELKAATTSKKRLINQNLQSIPNRIDEANRFINDTETRTAEEIEAELNQIETEIKIENDKLHNMTRDEEADITRRRLRQERNALADECATKIQERRKAHRDIVTAKTDAEYEVDRISRAISSYMDSVKTYRASVERDIKRLEDLRTEWKTAFNSKYEGDNTCPTCGQTLPAEKIAEAESKFNERKARSLDLITANANSIKANSEKTESNIAEVERKTTALTADLENAKAKFQTATYNVDRSQVELNDLIEKCDAEIKAKDKAIEEWENERGAHDTTTEVLRHIQIHISLLNERKSALSQALTAVKNNAMFKKRISELEDEARTLSAEYEALEKQDYLIGEFTRCKASMLERNINSKFKFAKFKLFEEQINGGIVETCEVMYDGVPYSVLNNAARINIGLDIINAFAKHYGFSATIFIDNAESVTNIFDTDSQQIKLYVSEADKVLRVVPDYKI